MKTRYREIPAYTTKDGSVIRELMHPAIHQDARRQSLAEATVPAGTVTLLHCHRNSEEIYHVTGGTGSMTLGDERFPLTVGDTVLIPPGAPHKVAADEAGPLRLLCCCAPAYDHEDTELLEEDGS